MFGSMFTLTCWEKARRTVPYNYILLFVFTLVESFFVGIITLQYDLKVVLLAMVLTAAVVLGLTIYALQTKYDFTMCFGLVLAGTIIMLVFGLAMSFFPQL